VHGAVQQEFYPEFLVEPEDIIGMMKVEYGSDRETGPLSETSMAMSTLVRSAVK